MHGLVCLPWEFAFNEVSFTCAVYHRWRKGLLRASDPQWKLWQNLQALSHPIIFILFSLLYQEILNRSKTYLYDISRDITPPVICNKELKLQRWYYRCMHRTYIDVTSGKPAETQELKQLRQTSWVQITTLRHLAARLSSTARGSSIW